MSHSQSLNHPPSDPTETNPSGITVEFKNTFINFLINKLSQESEISAQENLNAPNLLRARTTPCNSQEKVPLTAEQVFHGLKAFQMLQACHNNEQQVNDFRQLSTAPITEVSRITSLNSLFQDSAMTNNDGSVFTAAGAPSGQCDIKGQYFENVIPKSI